MLQRISRRWSDLCVVAASGPSLSADVAETCRGLPVIAVNDAWRLLPFADVLYACDASWWDHHRGCPDFRGEKWSSHGGSRHNDKRAAAARYGLNLVQGADGEGFSCDPAVIHYGENSGFQAVNLAMLMLGLAGTVLLVGFDMRLVEGRRHFFGDHPKGLKQTRTGYARWVQNFAKAKTSLPVGLRILNCTPGSAITCFENMDLRAALRHAA